MKYEIWGGVKPENYTPEVKLKEMSVDIPPEYDGWITIPAGCGTKGDNKIYLIFKKDEMTPRLELYHTREKLTGAVTSQYNEGSDILTNVGYLKLRRFDENLCFKNVVPVQDIYNAGNVVNGFSRPYGLPNLWISGHIKPEREEFVEFDYSIPKNINEIQMIFNSMLEEDHFYHMRITALPAVVSDYDIEITGQTGDRQIITQRDNYLRFKRHKVEIDNIVKIRFIFKATNGSPCFELYSIRLF